MKNISIVLLVIIAATFGFSNTGCKDTTTDPDPVDTTTTDTTSNSKLVKFTLGFDAYELDVDASGTYAVYNVAANTTYIYAKGNDGKLGNGDFEMEIDSNTTGTYTTASGAAYLGLGTGEGVRREEFTSDDGGITIVISEYGAVGGKVKGTFSGKVRKGINSYDVKNGSFEVVRKPDEQ